MSKNTRLIVILSVVTVLLIVILTVASRKGWIGKGKSTQVTTEEVIVRDITETVTASGKVYPKVEVKISPDVSGEIIELYVEEGDSVAKGDLLVKINPDIYESIVSRLAATLNQAKSNLANSKARLSQVKAQLDNAKLNYDRNKALYEQKIISEAEYENSLMSYKTAEAEMEAAEQTVLGAEYSVKSAEAGLKEAQDNLERTTIYSPIDGIISLLNVEKGERVVGTTQMPGTEILRIADFADLEVRVDVSENDIIRVQNGDTAIIDVDAYLDRDFKGVVTQISNSANATASLTSDQVTNFTVKIKLLPISYNDLISSDNPFPFRPGMSASADIQTARVQDVLVVPIQSVTLREEEDGNGKNTKETEITFVVVDGEIQRREVVTGIQDEEYIQIKEGVEEGEFVVSAPFRAISRTLEDGDIVEVVSREELFKNSKKNSD